MSKTVDNLKGYVTLVIAILALGGTIVAYFSKQAVKDTHIQQLQTEVRELKVEMKKSYDLQLKQAEINGMMYQYLKDH